MIYMCFLPTLVVFNPAEYLLRWCCWRRNYF